MKFKHLPSPKSPKSSAWGYLLGLLGLPGGGCVSNFRNSQHAMNEAVRLGYGDLPTTIGTGTPPAKARVRAGVPWMVASRMRGQ
jgi:hypothetical protein